MREHKLLAICLLLCACGKHRESRGSTPDARTLRPMVEFPQVDAKWTIQGRVWAAQRLKKSRKPQKVMIVRQHNMKKASQAMRRVGVGGTVKNRSGTKRISVPKPKPR